MAKYIFKSKRSDFNRKNAAFKEMVQGHMAMAIEVALKTNSGMPVKTGNMKSQTRHFRGTNGGYKVEVDVAYAAFQERGSRADGSHVVKNYTTSGTGRGFFLKAINKVLRNRNTYISEAKRALNL